MSASDVIRVLLVAPSTGIVGGQSIQADRLLRGFAGHPNVRLFLCPIDPPLPNWIRKLPYVRTIANMPLFYARLLRGTLQSDVVHAFTSSFWGYTLWVIPTIVLAKLTGRKVIINYRDGRAEHHLRDWRSASATLKHADAIITPSQYLVDVFGQFGIKVGVIPNAINMDAFPYRERLVVRPRFMTNRGLESLYNVDCTLRAFRLIQDRYPDAIFTVANDGPLRLQLESLATELRLQNVTFTGAVSQSRMAELYDAADIYVMSPLIDNMPGTVLECFAAGIPVVSTSSGGIPHVAEDGRTALLVPSASPEALANACFRLLEEPGLAPRIARAGYQECVARYSVASVVAGWTQLYRRLVSADHSSRP